MFKTEVYNGIYIYKYICNIYTYTYINILSILQCLNGNAPLIARMGKRKVKASRFSVAY